MAQQVIDETATTEGDPAAVYALLADGSTWPDWSPLGSFELIEPGDGVPEGLGAVRLFTTGRHQEPRAGRRPASPASVFAYELEAGLPLRDYRAVVTLAPGRRRARPSTGARRSGPRYPARAGSTGASWGRSSAGPSRGWRPRPDRARRPA